MKRYFVGVAAAVLGSALVGLAGMQHATAAPPTTTTTVTLPLFGAPLTLDITTGPGGNISDVTVDPADSLVATQLKPHKVVFKSADATDAARVVIKSKHGGQSVSVRAGSLADFTGTPGGWRGDVFGTDAMTTVGFEVIAGADGGPDITNITTDDPTAEIGAVKRSSGDDDENEQSARVSIKFTSADGSQSRTLTIKVKIEQEDEGTEAKLSISLGRIKGVALDAAAVAGPHTWTGSLCDGTAASVAYTVATGGAVSDVSATPDTADVRTHDGKIVVRFSNHEWLLIKVREHDGMIKISVMPVLKCDTGQPTVNGVDVTLPVPDDDHEGDHEGDHHDGDHDDWRFGGGDGGSGSGGGD
ncbi:MAG TPA: hypothetical protein VLD86_17095 [Ilumatobacteraceae bacterium]|nr:hypothetical protein [Ilumatobacteraceae bacterium]